MLKQKTLKESFSLSGKGLHTGLSLTVTFNPAPDNFGYKIQRTDLEGQPIIDAIAENVVEKHQHITENFADKVKKCIHFLINFPLLLNFQIENLSVPLRNISKRD